LPGIELAISGAKGRIQRGLDDIRMKAPHRFQKHHFLWACAVIPFFMLPPVFALIYAIMAMRKKTRPSIDANFEWIAIIAFVNIIVSALILYKVHFIAQDLITQWPDMVRSLLPRWFSFEAPQPRPSMKTLPI
jgi:hypothetical protein